MRIYALTVLSVLFSPALAFSQISFNGGGTNGGAVIVGSSTTTCDASTVGGLRYSGGTIQYCNGAVWDAINAIGGCDGTPASFNFADQSAVVNSTLTLSNILLITGTDPGCTTIVSVSGGGSPEFRVCSDSLCSSEVQTWTATNTSIDMNTRYLQLRATSASSDNTAVNVTASVGGVENTWTLSTASSGSCGTSPIVGQTCSDGSVYAGLAPDGNVEMYVTRCDAGMSWNGSNCTGIPTLLPWNNGDFSDGGTVNTGQASFNTGQANSAAIYAIDADSAVTGFQIHQSVEACETLTVHGHTDWYLPAKDELAIIYNNLQDGTPDDNSPDPLINGFSTINYWSSSDGGTDQAWRVNFDNGSENSNVSRKSYNYSIRCARRD